MAVGRKKISCPPYAEGTALSEKGYFRKEGHIF
jgi:hypothetical protein